MQLARLIGQIGDLPLQTIDIGEPGNRFRCISGLGGKLCLLLLSRLECLPNRFFLFRFKDRYTGGFSLENIQFLPLFTLALMNTYGYPAVDLRSRYLLQDRGPITRCRPEKRIEAALGQQHGS